MSLLGQWISNAAANAQQEQQYQKAAVQGAAFGQPPFIPPSFSENVPEDELVFVGICTRLLPLALARHRRSHNVDCCQRMLML
jgi:hypothetical protein